MKKILLFLSFLLISTGIWGATSSITFLVACGGSGIASDDAVWTITSDAAESDFDNTRGIHYGTSKKAVSYLNLSTSDIVGTITQIVVNASGASNTSAKLDVTIGGNAFGTQQNLTASATNYTLIGSATGEIVIAITQSSAKKALYCKSITITYTPNTTFTVSFINYLGKNPNNISQSSQGGNITLPTRIDVCNKCYSTNWVFEGWVESLENYEHIYTTTYTPTSNITLYALFSRGQKSVYIDKYRLVTENLDNWAGDYLIAYHPTIFADGRIGGTTSGGIGASGIYVTPNNHLHGDSIIDAEWGDLYNITLEEISESSNTYILKTKDGLTNYWTNNTNNGISTNNKATDYPITVNFISKSDIRISLGGTATGSVFRYNTGGYFRFYNNCTQNPIYLYKKQTIKKPVATEYSTSPECDTAYITTWNTDKIYLDKTLLNIADPQNITIKDINTGEILLNNSALSYNSDLDTYQIPINLSSKACDKLNILVKNATDSLYMIYKVPFMIDANSYTTDIIDENCDVVVLNNKTLTVSGTTSANRDLKLYLGAHLSVPNGTEYTVNSLSLRKDNIMSSTLGLSGTLNVNKLYFDLYVDAADWYWICLPSLFNLSNLKYINGRIPTYKKDFWIRWYDGFGRALTQSDAWTNVDHDKEFIQGEGFIFHLNNNLKKKEFRFELPTNAINIEKTNKNVSNLHAWGGNVPGLSPNHKGWNLIGNPFINSVITDLAEPISIGKLVKDTLSGQWNGKWIIDSESTTKTWRYAVIPSKDPEDALAGGYKSVVLDDIVLQPFTSFFVQIGGEDPEENQTIIFNTTDRGPLMAPKKFIDEKDEELFLRIKIGSKKTGCFISNHFNENYEPGDDLESRYAYYQLINGYKLLYSAINDSIIENGIQIHSLSGKVTLDPKVETEKFEQIYILYNNEWYDLLHGDEPEVSGDFILYGKRKANEDISTDIGNIKPSQETYKFINGNNVYINNKGKIYNIFGNSIQ